NVRHALRPFRIALELFQEQADTLEDSQAFIRCRRDAMFKTAAQRPAKLGYLVARPVYQAQLDVRVVGVVDATQRFIDLFYSTLDRFLMLLETSVEHQQVANEIFVQVVLEPFLVTREILFLDALKYRGKTIGVGAA